MGTRPSWSSSSSSSNRYSGGGRYDSSWPGGAILGALIFIGPLRFSSSESGSSDHIDSAAAKKAASPSGAAALRAARFSARVLSRPDARPSAIFATRMASHLDGRKRRFGSGAPDMGVTIFWDVK